MVEKIKDKKIYVSPTIEVYEAEGVYPLATSPYIGGGTEEGTEEGEGDGDAFVKGVKNFDDDENCPFSIFDTEF